jgi:hypothetical protein
MKVFYGAAIQGSRRRGERREVHRRIMHAIKTAGGTLVSEHTLGASFDETAYLLEASLGPLPPAGLERTIHVRNRMIELIEGDVGAAIFECSVPSLGTGIELAHAYLRPRLGLPGIPILVLYETDFWPAHLSSMVRGLCQHQYPGFLLKEFSSLEEVEALVTAFLSEYPEPEAA